MTGSIFVNYRRDDEGGWTWALFSELEKQYPRERLFMDVEGGIKAGDDFVSVLEGQVAQCDLFLVVIGPSWLDAKDAAGRRRLDSQDDPVRVEIVSALKSGKRVIPVLVNKADVPRRESLPEDLKPLAQRHAVRLTPERFAADCQGLTKEIEDGLVVVEAERQMRTKEAEAAAAARTVAEVRASEAERKRDEEQQRATARGLSSEEIAKAEELANWDFIKSSDNPQELRDHLARFPAGVTARMARARLEALAWSAIGVEADLATLKDFLAEFPDGSHSREARARQKALERTAEAARQAAERIRSETEAWASASGADTIETYTTFLGLWPDSAHAEAARARVRELKGGVRISRRAAVIGGGALALTGAGAFAAVTGEANRLWVRLSDSSIRTFRGHIAPVNSVAFSPDGKMALSGSADTTLKLWDIATGDVIRTFTGQENSRANCVAFSRDGKTALSGGQSFLNRWNVATGQEVGAFPVRANDVASIVISPDGVTALSGDWDNELTLWDIATGDGIRRFPGHIGPVTSVAFSPPDGKMALSGSWDETVMLWDIATAHSIRSFPSHGGHVNSVAFPPHDGSTALSGGDDNTLKLWDVATGDRIRTFSGHIGPVTSVAFSPQDGSTALSGGDDNMLKLWEIATGDVIQTFIGHTAAVKSVAFSPDGRNVLSGSADRTLKLWALPQPKS